MSFLLDRERELVRHALGCWDGYGRRPVEGCRNHFVASTGSADDRAWQSIATRGLVVAGRLVLDQTGGSTIYYVTREGARLAGLSEAAIVRACGTREERARQRAKYQRDRERRSRALLAQRADGGARRNSVCPPVATALVRANVSNLNEKRGAA